MALKRDAAAERSKDQLSLDFPGRSIFDFCDNIGPKRKSSCARIVVKTRRAAASFPLVAFDSIE